MAQREIQMDKIITQMNLDSAVNAIFGWRIYWGKPVSDVQDWIYCMLNIITKPIVEASYCMVRVEARIVAKDTTTTLKTLLDAKNVISTYLESQSNHAGFFTFKITEWGNFFNALDEKLRGVLVQDYLFYFATS